MSPPSTHTSSVRGRAMELCGVGPVSRGCLAARVYPRVLRRRVPSCSCAGVLRSSRSNICTRGESHTDDTRFASTRKRFVKTTGIDIYLYLYIMSAIRDGCGYVVVAIPCGNCRSEKTVYVGRVGTIYCCGTNTYIYIIYIYI